MLSEKFNVKVTLSFMQYSSELLVLEMEQAGSAIEPRVIQDYNEFVGATRLPFCQ